MDGALIAGNVEELRPSIARIRENHASNLGYVDHRAVDFDGEGRIFYSNRTDFIRTAIPQPARTPRRDVVKQSTARKSLELGLRNYSRTDLERRRKQAG